MTMAEVINKVIWLQGLLDDLKIEHNILKINCDSISAIYLAKNQAYHVRTKRLSCKNEAYRRQVPLCSEDS